MKTTPLPRCRISSSSLLSRTRLAMGGVLGLVAFAGALAPAALSAQVKRDEHRVGIDRDPDVVHLADFLKDPVVLHVKDAAVVFSDKSGNTKLGTLLADQDVVLEAMSDRAYRVRGKGPSGKIAGWVGPKFFSSADPNSEENLKKFYNRQIEVAGLIAQKKVAVGMTPDEVNLALGKPTKTEMRQTANGTSGRWEYITYQDVSNYAYVRDPATGQLFRQLVSVTKEIKSKTAVDFQGGVVAALEESEDRHAARAKIVVPPIVFAW